MNFSRPFLKKTARNAPCGGFTLTEVMIAVVVLTIGILGWMAFQGMSIRGRAFSREMTRALEVTQDKVEEMSGVVAGWDDSHADVNGAADNATDLLTLGNFTYTREWWIIGGNPAGSVRRFWRVRVATTWGDDKSRTLELVRLVPGKEAE